MFIINPHGILHGWPDDLPMPAGHRKATEHEIGVFMHTGQQDTKKMPVALGGTEPQAPTAAAETTLAADSGNKPPTPVKPLIARPTRPPSKRAKGKR